MQFVKECKGIQPSLVKEKLENLLVSYYEKSVGPMKEKVMETFSKSINSTSKMVEGTLLETNKIKALIEEETLLATKALVEAEIQVRIVTIATINFVES